MDAESGLDAQVAGSHRSLARAHLKREASPDRITSCARCFPSKVRRVRSIDQLRRVRERDFAQWEVNVNHRARLQGDDWE